MRASLLLAALLLSTGAGAIVIRDDVDDTKYRIGSNEFPALADLPGEGHGVLISDRWIVTAAHAVTWQSHIKQVVINGLPRQVERVVVHPGYAKPPQALLDQSLQSWDWTLFRASLWASADIALIQLAEPVSDIAPMTPYAQGDEHGRLLQVVGKGATGNGVEGYAFDSPRRTALRRAYNRVSSAHGAWFCYTFDTPAQALPLEGSSGSGDSGGPVLISTDGGWRLAGLTSWIDPQSTVRRAGRYGQVSCNVRLSHYKDWIDRVMAGGQ